MKLRFGILDPSPLAGRSLLRDGIIEEPTPSGPITSFTSYEPTIRSFSYEPHTRHDSRWEGAGFSNLLSAIKGATDDLGLIIFVTEEAGNDWAPIEADIALPESIGPEEIVQANREASFVQPGETPKGGSGRIR